MALAGSRVPRLTRGRLMAVLLVGICWTTISPRPALSDARDPGYEYLSPVPGAHLVSPWTSVVLRPPGTVDAATIRGAALTTKGSQSGLHSGRLELSDDHQTLVFTPDSPFAEGESVVVTLASGIRTQAGAPLPAVSFAFTITPRDPKREPVMVADEATGRLMPLDRLASRPTGASGALPTQMAGSDTLPPGMPFVSLMKSDHPDTGNVFLATFSGFASKGNLMILDNAAQPMFFRALPGPAFDFKRQPNGLLTYFSGTNTFWALDSSYAVVDSFRAGNGYTADLHDLQLLPNGHALLLIYDPEPLRMDSIVPGGQPNATVIGLVVQELDAAKHVVFQWRSWDHFRITDADTCLIDLRSMMVDYVHGNAVEPDADGNILISSRSMNEITKINRATGAVMWRWGLHAVNNQFSFMNDARGFGAQHDIRRLPNGNVTLFDNGNCLGNPQHSRVAEYRLDEISKTATLVREFRNSPDLYTPFMGNGQRRASGGTMIGWGGTALDPKLTDVHADGSVALAFGLKFATTWTYRAFRFPWQTSRFSVTPTALNFGAIDIGGSATRSFRVSNRSTATVEITSVVGHNAAFSVLSALPITLAPGQSDSIRVHFLPPDLGGFGDTLYVRSVSPTELVALAVPVTGSCYANGVWIEDFSHYEGNTVLVPFMFQIRLAAARPTSVSVRYQTADGTATVADNDYVPTGGQAFIMPGETTSVVTVYVRADRKVESDEKFYVNLFNPSPGLVIDRPQAVGTIIDDDRFADVGDAGAPVAFALHSPIPNPGHAAVIRFDLPRACDARLEVFDLSGRRVATLVDERLPAGRHAATWAPGGGLRGVFLYRLRAGDFEATRKLVLMR